MGSDSDTSEIHSTFADDEEMTELIEMFVEELPQRIDGFSDALIGGEWDTLRRLAHQLKGAAPSYGFESIGRAAATVESLADDDVALDRITCAVDELLSLCKRVSL